MIKILFDATDITEQRRFMSIPQYKLRLLEAFSSQEKKYITLLVDKNNVDYVRKICPQFTICLIDYRKNLLARIPYIRRYVYPWVFKKAVEASGCDVFFSASDPIGLTKLKMKIPKVIVIHDLKLIKSDYTKNSRVAYKIIRQNIDTATHVIAISNYTKEDILANFKCAESKISVVYNSVNVIAKSVCPQKRLPNKYILWVNTFDPYKNVLTFLKGYAEVYNQIHQDIVLVGKESNYWKEMCLPFIKQKGFEDRIHVLFGISDEEVRYLYEHADLFVTTSTHEGFGYTPIEAALYKCPVISTKCEALSDTSQGKFTYLDSPYDYQQLSKLILEKLNEKCDSEFLCEISEYFRDKYDVKKQKNEILKILQKAKVFDV